MILFSFLSAILLHECGHLFGLVLAKAHIRKARLSPFGITLSHSPLCSELAAFTVAALGPIAGVIGYIVLHYSNSLPLFSKISLALSLFNLLPIRSLDGGRMLHALASALTPPHTAEAITRRISHTALLFLWFVGLYTFFFLGLSPTLFLMSLTLFFEELKLEG